MIIAIVGGIGSGKTLTAVKHIIENPDLSFTNFNLKNCKNYKRIKISDILNMPEKRKKSGLLDVSEWSVNWEYWEKARKTNPQFSIFLDEVHNIIHARASMTKRNILLSKWVSQIRKILSDSETNNLYIISQTLRKIDVDFRDLAQVFILCKKVQKGKNVWIINEYYDDIEKVGVMRPMFKRYFYANPFFKYYNTNEMVNFEDAEEFI